MTELSRHNGSEKENNGSLMCPTCSRQERTAVRSMENLSSATAECQVLSKKMTLQGKSHTCGSSSPTQTSYKTSEADSTSREKGFSTFYDGSCKEISSLLLSHTEIDSAGSDSNSSTSSSNRTVEKSWFSTIRRLHHKENSQRICSQFFTPSRAECTVSESIKTKSRKIRIYPTQRQRVLFRQWLGVSRMMYNCTVEKYSKRTRDDKKSWMDYAKDVMQEHDEEYVKEVPYQIKKMAVKDCYVSWVSNCRKAKRVGRAFTLRFRTRKNPRQSCYIPKSAVRESGIYHTISGSLKYAERDWLDNEIQDCRLVCEYGKWFIVVPMRISAYRTAENQGGAVAIDPGIRTFATYFSTDGRFGQLGIRSFERILRLNLKIDKLLSRLSMEKSKEKRIRLYRSVCKVRFRLRCLVDELHWKCIAWLTDNFRVVIYPPFNVSEMTKGKRLPKVVKRSMLQLNFYRFKERLRERCNERKILYIEEDESYTSKTNSFNGERLGIGSKEYFVYDGVTLNRDINGARNILLCGMRDSSACV